MSAIRAIVILLLFALPASAAELPAAPSAHKFWDKTNIVLFATHAGMTGWDAYQTHRDAASVCIQWDMQGKCFNHYSGGFREANPIGRPFVKSTAGQIAFFGGEVAANILGAYILHRTGHHKWDASFLS